VINTSKHTGDTMVGQRSGAMTSMEVVTGDIEFFTLYTTLDITNTDDFGDNSQKDFESVVQVIGMRAMPIVMNNPVELNGTGNNVLENYGAPSMTGAGYIFKFATERPGAHTIETLVNEFDNIVLNGGTVDTKNSINMEFTKQDLL
jgi:hypothetical protein